MGLLSGATLCSMVFFHRRRQHPSRVVRTNDLRVHTRCSRVAIMFSTSPSKKFCNIRHLHGYSQFAWQVVGSRGSSCRQIVWTSTASLQDVNAISLDRAITIGKHPVPFQKGKTLCAGVRLTRSQSRDILDCGWESRW